MPRGKLSSLYGQEQLNPLHNQTPKEFFLYSHSRVLCSVGIACTGERCRPRYLRHRNSSRACLHFTEKGVPGKF